MAEFFCPRESLARAASDRNLPTVVRYFKLLFEKKLEAGLPLLKALHFVRSEQKQSLSAPFAVFSPVYKTIFFQSFLEEQSEVQQIKVLAHELGHAFAFERLTPAQLAELSSNYGPWKKLGESELTQLSEKGFNAKFLMDPHPMQNDSAGALSAMPNTPTRYALGSRHEWVAEVFSQWVATLVAQEFHNVSFGAELASATMTRSNEPALSADLVEQMQLHLETKAGAAVIFENRH